MKNDIQMVNLTSQYQKIQTEIDKAVLDVLYKGQYINGPEVKEFSENLSYYLNTKHVIPCANGTDALQIALMSLDLTPGDEVIVPSFTYVATAEVISLLGLIPIMADVDPNTFNITAEIIKPLISVKTKAIVPVHLFGQSCDMEEIMNLAIEKNIYVIEDNAQAIGAEYTFTNGEKKFTGTIGHIGTTSFFPSKNLGCYGDGGAIFTNDDILANKLKMIANHGQEIKYYHKVIGCNSRLDTIQAAILNIKLKYLANYNSARNEMAERYDHAFKDISDIQIPIRQHNSNHVFHQYTLKINQKIRSNFIDYLKTKNIPAMIYYPVPLYKQEAFKDYCHPDFEISNIESLCSSVISLPIHTEIKESSQDYIIECVLNYFKN